MNEISGQTKHPLQRNRVLLIAGGIAIVAIAVFVLWWRSSGSTRQLTAPALQRVQSVDATLIPAIGRVDLQRPLPMARSGESDWERILEKVTALLNGKKTEVCGLSDLDAARFLAGDPEVGTGTVNATLTQVKDKFVKSDDPREQALGLYIQANLAEGASMGEQQRKFRICNGDFDCQLKIVTDNNPVARSQELQAQAAEPLVKLALAGRDPGIIAAAIYACRGARTGACGSISYANWAAVEPDNAAVWLMMADATSEKDPGARESALRHAAAANGFEMRLPALTAAFETDLVRAQPLLAQTAIGEQLAISNFSVLQPSWTLSSYCLHDKRNGGGNKTLCDTLANKLLEKDGNVIGLSIATAIGKKIGWDSERLQVLMDEKVVAMGLIFDSANRRNLYSCEGQTKYNQWIQGTLSKNERTIAREYIAASGKTLAEVAADYRKAYPGSFK